MMTRSGSTTDADANIIVGATFDESLVGIIRVPVVATGVEIRPSSLTASPSRHGSADIHEAVIAELAQRVKAEKARSTEPAETPEMWARRAVYRG
jgi:cell division protein FtsZ